MAAVVRLEPDHLLILDDGALGLPGPEVAARQTEPDDRIIRHQLGHLFEGDGAVKVATVVLCIRAPRAT